MTLLANRPTETEVEPEAPARPSSPAPRVPPGPRRAAPLTPGRIAVIAVAWVGVTMAIVAIVAYGAGPLLQDRDQHRLLDDYRTEVRQSAAAVDSLAGPEVPTQAPGLGEPVAILDIHGLRLQQVVVEGAGPNQTRRGPGHVPGTAGPGQPGNSVIVARRSAYGGPFRELGDVRRGDRILVTTTQGQTVYRVRSVRTDDVVEPPDGSESALGAPASARPKRDQITTEELYGPSDGDQLTLVTSASAAPWQQTRATVVVARMVGLPFSPTPPNGRSDAQDGRHGDQSARASLVLSLIGYVLTIVAATWLYRRYRLRSAYLLTAPPLIAMAFLLAENVTRLMPAWF